MLSVGEKRDRPDAEAPESSDHPTATIAAASAQGTIIESQSTALASPAPKRMRATSALERGYKLALIVRSDLGMGKGKMCAQCSHAALGAYRHSLASKRGRSAVEAWEATGETKIALKAGSEADLLTLRERAAAAGLVAALVRDAGHTQVASGSITVLAIGPDDEAAVDKITGHLKLL